jgi:RNA polymerase sigma-70 factor (ECF subfamily)
LSDESLSTPPAAEFEDHFFRREFSRTVATLTRIFGPRHIALAEDAAQEALFKAMQQWPHTGPPANPQAWLIQAAKNAALDALRREATLARKRDEMARAVSAAGAQPDVDDELTMMFLCCHPEIPREAQVALALKTVSGFSASEIANAFLISEATAAQRVVRAKRTIREKRLRFELNTGAESVEAVLAALYLMFNEGYASGGDQLIRRDLIEESIRLARAVADNPRTGSPECDALLALLLLQSARAASREDDRGEMFLLENQNRELWDRGRIAEGIARLDRSARGENISRYHIEAAIAGEHALAPDFGGTKWGEIVRLYDDLYALHPSPVVALNRAIAIARRSGAAAGIEELRQIEDHPSLAGYRLLPAAMGALWREAGDAARAARYFEKALECNCPGPERRRLERLLAECVAEANLRGEESAR